MNIQEELEKNYVDGPEAAKILKLSPMRIRTLCQGGRFQGAFKFGSIWILPKVAVANHTKLKAGAKPRNNKAILTQIKDELGQAQNEK